MAEKQVLSAEDIRRAVSRIAHEVLERNRGTQDLVLMGIYTRGVPLARRFAKRIQDLERVHLPVGTLDIGLYRDDTTARAKPTVHPTELPVDISDKRVVLVDDVLFTGRTIRAALDALSDFGRPSQVQLAVLVDRGHRELPIRPDYVGKNIPTALDERVKVRLEETDGRDEVLLIPGEEKR